MFFKSLCPTVMLASVHSGVMYSSYNERSAMTEKVEEDRKGEKENLGGPREKNEEVKPVPSPHEAIPSPPKKASLSKPIIRPQKPTSPKPVAVEDEDKENRPSPAGGRQRESRTKSREVRRSKEPEDNKLRRMPGRCLSPFAMGARCALSVPKAKLAEAPRAPSPARAITPLSNVQNIRPRSPAAAPRGIPTPLGKRNSRRDQKPCQRSPLRITKTAMTLSPNQKLSIVYRHDRFFWDAIEVDDIKGY
ncbi:hypothetical protein J437_LFUL010539 [Ladona fulva]|uniref:Uncharacterized protein n=1 Tax=Ladona fulva TaxID=123851 RepID=A0A8K0K943_LADFU|nr:hypothetical protein J437_LFUL010539 [Ladona fulva]